MSHRHEMRQVEPGVALWRCVECRYLTDNLSNVAWHVVAHQFTYGREP